jgi:hypothetical protein
MDLWNGMINSLQILNKSLHLYKLKPERMKKEQVQASLYRKVWDAKREIGKVYKNAQSHHSRYADLNAILDTVEPVLFSFGLIIMQPINDNKVTTQLIDIDSGDMVESSIELPAITNPLQIGSAISYFRRYTLSSLLSISTTDDDDAVSASKAAPAKPKATDDLVNKFAQSLADGTAKWTVEKFTANYELTEEQLKLIEGV